jgi:Protein of unknown function (DUF2283)
MFVRLAPPARAEEVSPGVIFDFDEDGRLLGIEELDVLDRMTAPPKAA